MKCIEIDGSIMEGGGQILRISTCLSSLLRKPIHIHSIRAKRSKPGLRNQHSTGIKLIADLCGGIVNPREIQFGSGAIGTSELHLFPGNEGLNAPVA